MLRLRSVEFCMWRKYKMNEILAKLLPLWSCYESWINVTIKGHDQVGKNLYLCMGIREDAGRNWERVLPAYSMVLSCDSLTPAGLSEKSVFQRNAHAQPALEILSRDVLLLINELIKWGVSTDLSYPGWSILETCNKKHLICLEEPKV